MREQNQYVYDFLDVLENKIDYIRSQRRQQENKSLISIDSEAPYKKEVKTFSFRDIAEIFPVLEIRISPENNLALTVVMTDKVYAELNQEHVRDTSWFPKVLAEMHTLPEKRGELEEFEKMFFNKTNYT